MKKIASIDMAAYRSMPPIFDLLTQKNGRVIKVGRQLTTERARAINIRATAAIVPAQSGRVLDLFQDGKRHKQLEAPLERVV